MKTTVRLTVLLCLFSAVWSGCGGGGGSSTSTTTTSVTQQPAPIPSLTGNWFITGSSQAVSNTNFAVGGNLTNSNSSVSGVLHIANSQCFNFADNLSVSGTIDNTGKLHLVSLPDATGGEIVTADGTISADGATLSNGTYSISGTCAGGDHGTLSGNREPSFTGTFSGTATTPGSTQTAGINASITQSGPDSSGFLHLSGTATFTNSCFTQASITSSIAVGNALSITLSDNAGQSLDFTGNYTDASGKTITGTYSINGGLCSGESGNTTLTRQ